MKPWFFLICVGVLYGADILRTLWRLRQQAIGVSQSGRVSEELFPTVLRGAQILGLTILLLIFLPEEFTQESPVFGVIICCTVLALVLQGVFVFRILKARRMSQNLALQRYTFPYNPLFEEVWAKNPQYYELRGMRLRKVELPHWQMQEIDFQASLCVVEGVVIISSLSGNITWDRASKSFDNSLLVYEEMGFKSEWAKLISDSRGITSSTAQANKGSGKRYPELIERMECFLVLGTMTKISAKLAQPFAPAVYRRVNIFNNIDEAIVAALQHFVSITSALPTLIPTYIKHGMKQEESNPMFEEYWQRRPGYFDYKNVRIRQVKSDEWNYVSSAATGFTSSLSLLENGVIFQRVSGMATGDETIASIRMTQAMVRQMDVGKYPSLWLIDGTNLSPTLSNDSMKQAGAFFADFGNLQGIYLVLPPAIAIISRFALFFNGDVYSKLHIFSTIEEALERVLVVGNFQKNSDNNAFTGKNLALTPSYHEQRIAEIYTMLAKISDDEANTIEVPDIPPEDMYYDVFRAMSVVNDDKRRQMDALLTQQELLQKQAAEIQETNTMLSERLHQLDEQNRLLEILDHEKNELMGIVAHDLKNPIGAVRGLADIILFGYADAEQIQSVAHQIVNISNRMLELVTNLLDVNRLETGNMHLNLVIVDLIPIAETSIWGFEQVAAAKNINLEFSNESTQSMTLVDEQAMTQVLDNLISNAVKYSPYGKKVYVRIKNNHSPLTTVHWPNDNATTNVLMANDKISDDRWVRIEVQDEGPGISEEDMKKLFGKFARLSAQPTGGEHSTGLGLSIVKKMVEAMQGRVWCESELGRGATFIVELPTELPPK